MNTERMVKIKTFLQQSLEPDSVEIVDDSAKHKGHEGAKAGGGHFNVTIVAKIFQNKTLIQRHRLVYDALNEMMKQEIHALSIKAITPEEK